MFVPAGSNVRRRASSFGFFTECVVGVSGEITVVVNVGGGAAAVGAVVFRATFVSALTARLSDLAVLFAAWTSAFVTGFAARVSAFRARVSILAVGFALVVAGFAAVW